MNVFIVTAGDYSDYYIEAVFTDRTKAERYVEIRNRQSTYSYQNCRVEEYEADCVEASPIGTFGVVKGADGTLYVAFEEYSDATDSEVHELYGGVIRVDVRAETPEQAKKIAIDRFTVYEAERSGGT